MLCVRCVLLALSRSHALPERIHKVSRSAQVFDHEKVCRSLSGVPFEGCGFSLLPASGSVFWSHGSSLERGFRKLVFGSRRKRACKRWVRVTLKGRIVRHSLPVKGKHSWRPMMRVLCLVRKVLEKFTAPRVRCKAEAQWTPEAERVVHRSRMLADSC